MGWDAPDVYYNPEQFDLTVIGEIEWTAPCYEFDLTVVWKHASGLFFWASDAGCSCPSPFENFTSLEDMEGSGSKWDAIKAIQKMLSDTEKFQDNVYAAPQVADLTAKIMEAL